MPASRHGVSFEGDSVVFRVWAPRLQTLLIRLDGKDLPMDRTADGFFSHRVPHLRAGARYQFLLPDGSVRPDPATMRQPEGVHGPSEVFDAGAYKWENEGFPGLPLEECVFYELHLGTFTSEGTLDAAALRLPDLAALGVSCVELMPVQPFPGTRNWGYDGVAPFGVQESYGGPAALQRFVDRAHGLGLSVCLDVVYNHLGPEGNYLRDFGPYFTSRHKSPWGDGINFDGEDAGPVRDFVIEAALQWVRAFKVDALRLDAVHAIPDDSPRHVIGELCDQLRRVSVAEERQIHVIVESDLNDRKVVDAAPLGWGASATWADDFHHALHTTLTGEKAHFYADFQNADDLVKALAQGFVYQGQHSPFRNKPHGTETRGLRPMQFVFCAQNHDQAGNRPNGERLSALVPFEALRPVAAAVVLAPALPMLFMGEEYGETLPFLYFTSHSDPALAKAVSEGRKSEFIAAGGAGEAPDPQAEQTLRSCVLTHRREGRHGELWTLHRELLAIRRRHCQEMARVWPEVSREGLALRWSWPSLEVKVNLGAEPAMGLPGFGHLVKEISSQQRAPV